MPQTPAPRPDKRRKSLLILEFSSLAVLLVSMGWFSNLSSAGNPVHPAWLLVPAAASLGVFLSFIGLMYLRWVRSEEHTSELQSRPHLVCRLLLEKKKTSTRLSSPSSY